MFAIADIDVGAKLHNNDKRGIVGGVREVVITAIERKGVAVDQNWAIYQASTRKVRVRFDRIHLDGRARGSGYNLISRAE